MIWKFLYQLASPKSFYHLAGSFSRWLLVAFTVLFVAGLYTGLVVAPADYQQGDAFRIIYLHVPAAFLSLALYSLMAFCAVLTLVWRIKLADIITRVTAPIGAWMTFLALLTGAVWGKPMWGTWWIWDARLTSELILFFVYLAIIAFGHAVQHKSQGAKLLAVMVLIGFVDIPVIHYSVYWWNTLHQGASLSLLSKPKIVGSMLYPLLIMIAAFFCFVGHQILQRARQQVLWQEKKSQWVTTLIGERA